VKAAERLQVKSSFSADSKMQGSSVVPQKGCMIAILRSDTMLLAKSLGPPETADEIS